MNSTSYPSIPFRRWLLVVLFPASLASPCAPHAFAAASPSPTAENVTALSAQRADAERAKIDRAGVGYTKWLDRVAERSDQAFLDRVVFGRVSWMRLLSSATCSR